MNSLSNQQKALSMDVRFLVTFLEVVKTRHFGKTAENLFLTPSAVSARIKQLEEYFNSPLFIRNRNSIQLTAAGHKLVPYAESLAVTLNEAVKAINNVNVQHIAIAGTPNAWELYLSQTLGAISEYFPALSVHADIMTNEQLARQLHNRTLDLAVVSEPLKSDQITMQPLLNVSLALYMNQLVDDEIDDVAKRYINLEWHAKAREEVERHFPGTRDAKFNTSSIRIALELLLNQGGMALLPVSIAEHYVQQGQLSKVSVCKEFQCSLKLAYLHEVNHPGLSEFIDFLLSMPKQEASLKLIVNQR
jgi:LysR family transcriptional regulator, flagellar master operon regulator